MTRRTLLGAVGAVAIFPPLASAVNAAEPRAMVPVMEIGLRIGQPQAAAHGRRWAVVQAGMVAGSLMQGTVQSGQLEWLVDPASGAVEVAVNVRVLRADGVLVELRDRTVHAGADGLTELPGLPTAPALFDPAGKLLLAPALLAGRLDATDLGRGVVRLRAFDLR